MMRNNAAALNYGSLFRSLPIPHIIFWADTNYTIADQNSAHAAITYTQTSDIIGKPVLEAFPDKSETYLKTGKSDLIGSLDKVANGGKPDSMPLIKYDIRNRSGVYEERWWQVTHYPLNSDDGNLEAILQITNDVTQEVSTRQSLDSTTSQLQSALDVGLVSAWSWDMKNDVVIGDANLAKTFGVTIKYAATGLPLRTFINSIHTDDRGRVSDAIGESVANGKAYEQEYRIINDDEKISCVIARGEVIHDNNGIPINFRGILIDITGRKIAEAKLEASEAMFRAMFDSTILAIAMVDMSGNIIQTNKTFLELFHYSSEDLERGLTSADLSLDGSDTTTRQIYESLKRTGEAEPTEKKYVRSDGSTFSALVGAAMLPGQKDRFMAFILDTSEIEKLKAMNDAKDEFIALASHQLRSPASVVKQYLGVLINEMAGPISEDQLQYLNIANNANNRQLDIINDLLKTAQLDTKGYQLTLLPHNLVKITKDIIEQYEPVVDAKKQRILFEPSTDNAIARLDKAEISICISNLIENASKYSPAESTITIIIAQTKMYLDLSVSDQGVGIKKQDRDHIFEKFSRVNNVLSDTTSGSGLGLYWVRRIVDIHNGTISVKSTLGKGTTFSVRLPV